MPMLDEACVAQTASRHNKKSNVGCQTYHGPDYLYTVQRAAHGRDEPFLNLNLNRIYGGGFDTEFQTSRFGALGEDHQSTRTKPTSASSQIKIRIKIKIKNIKAVNGPLYCV